MTTKKQQQRQEYRERGQYAKVNPCYRCGKSAGVEYESDPRTDDLVNDEALCLCGPCAQLLVQLPDAEFLIEVARPDYGHLPQGKRGA